MQVFSERGCKYGTLETVCPGVDRKGVKIEEAKWMDIRSDRQKGLSYTEIGRKYNIDPRTAKRYAQAETRPVYSLSEPKPSKLDPYKEQIAVWLEEAPYSAERILEKIREQGLDGGHSIVREYVRGKKQRCGLRRCLASKGRWTGAFSRTTRCTRTGSGKSCIAFS